MTYYTHSRSQKGVVLIVSLIMLLIMTLVGAATMQNSTLQERMAANAKQKMLANLSAQSALKAAEEYLAAQAFITENRLISDFLSVNGHYNLSMVNATEPANPSVLNSYDAGAWTNVNSIEVAGLTSGVTAKNPRYTIEYIGSDTISENDVATTLPDNNPPSKPYFFRITAIGWALDENIYSVLETSFMSTP